MSSKSNLEESIRLVDETTKPKPLTLELVGTRREEDDGGPRQVRVSIDQMENDKQTGNPKFLVSLSPLMDTAHAGCAVDLLLDRWDTQHTYLHTLILSGLRFTQGGVSALTTFWGMQNVAKSIEQIIFCDIIGGEILREDEDSVFTICKMFQNAPNLETIDLSHNAVGTYVWEALGKQVKLKHLTLNDVEMDDCSFQELCNNFASGETLQSFTLFNRTKMGPAACQALDHMLKSCRNLRSFVWEQSNRNHKPQENLPILGLAQLSKNMFKNNFGYLIRLELTGGIVPNDPTPLCDALEGFHKLQQLKLSRARLDSEKIQRIVTALRSARPPLSMIDFSCNQIDCEGASWIAQLSCLRAVTKNLQLLNLEHNRIAQKGVMEIVESFAPKAGAFDLKLEGNDFDPSHMFLSLASAKHRAETELKALKKDAERLKADKEDAQSNLRELLQAQYTMVSDMHELKEKAKQLEEDKASLVKAFGVLGMMQHVEERDHILSRLEELEEAVLGKANVKNGFKRGKKPPSSPSRPTAESPEPTHFSRNAGKSKSFDSNKPPPFHLDRGHHSMSFDDHNEPLTAAAAMSASMSNLSRTRAMNRRTSARHLMVRAASERWKNLLNNPNEKEKEKSRPKPMRSASTKSLAEFLSRSDSERGGFDDSGSLLEDQSLQTAPVSHNSLSGARRQFRDNFSATRSLPPRNEVKSHLHPPPPLKQMNPDLHDSVQIFNVDDSG